MKAVGKEKKEAKEVEKKEPMFIDRKSKVVKLSDIEFTAPKGTISFDSEIEF